VIRSAFSFHPRTLTLAASGEGGKSINVWNISVAALLSDEVDRQSIVYRSSKVVLLGDSGVGKSGLGLVLSRQPFRPTESTHGHRVTTMFREETVAAQGQREVREVLLWDLAGQPAYRMINPLQLDDVAVALHVFDPSREDSSLDSVRYWARALQQAQRKAGGAVPAVRKFLVAARVDRGGVMVSRERINAIVREFGFDGYFETSAKTGQYIDVLADTVRRAIDWDALPLTVSSEIFDKTGVLQSQINPS